MALRRWLRRRALRARCHRELEEELGYHVERSADELRATGMRADLATQLARRRLGNTVAIQQQVRDIAGMSFWGRLGRDATFTVRGLRHERGTLAVVIRCLTVGIVSTTTVFGLVDGFLLRDVTARDAHRLVSVGSLSWPNFRDLTAYGVFDELAAGGQCGLRWRDHDRVQAVVGNCLSANFFTVGGGQTALGRTFTEEEAAPETDPRIAILSHRFWRRLGGDPSVIGRTLTLNEQPWTVIGVFPADYRAIQGYGVSPDVFVPYGPSVQPLLFERNAPATDRLEVVGRLRPQWTTEQTRHALIVALRELHRLHPTSVRDPEQAPPPLTPKSGLGKYGSSEFDPFILRGAGGLSVAVMLVLIIACANAAGLMLARGLTRVSALQVQLALGASRGHLTRQLFGEALVVAAISVALALLLVIWIGQVLASVEIPVQGTIIQLLHVRDWRLFAAASAAGICCALASGVLPAVFAAQAEAGQLASRTTIPIRRAQSGLVLGQVGVSLVVLVAAFLLITNAWSVTQQGPGFDVTHTAWFDLAIDRRMSTEERTAVRDRAVRLLTDDPGVEAVSWTWYLPFQVAYAEPRVQSADDHTPSVAVIEQGIGPGYLATMQIPVIDGREFTHTDLTQPSDAPQPVIVNAELARRLFPARRAVGERLIRGELEAPGPLLVVIGVSADTPFRLAGEHPPSLLQSLTPYTASLVVRTISPAARALASTSSTLDRAQPGIVGGAYAVSERWYHGTVLARGAATVLALLAGAGLLVTTVGVCALLLCTVARRRREAAIRVALGATKHQISGLIVTEHVRLVAWGCAFGAPLALAASVPLASFLTGGVSATTPVLLGAAIGLMLTLTMALSWLLSRGLSRIEPSVALRAE